METYITGIIYPPAPSLIFRILADFILVIILLGVIVGGFKLIKHIYWDEK